MLVPKISKDYTQIKNPYEKFVMKINIFRKRAKFHEVAPR
jgi:hypothetical protein